jgi:hypothetical protein
MNPSAMKIYIYIYIYIRVDHMNGSIFAVHQHRQILCDVLTYCRLSLFLVVVVVVVFSQTITNNKKNLTYLKILHQLGKHHRIHSEFSKRFSFSKILLKLFWCCIFYVCQINNNDPQPIVERWKKKRKRWWWWSEVIGVRVDRWVQLQPKRYYTYFDSIDSYLLYISDTYCSYLTSSIKSKILNPTP